MWANLQITPEDSFVLHTFWCF